MSMARNDIRHAMELAVEANKNDAPEFTYFVRLSMAHWIEGHEALDRWCSVPEVAAFMKQLSPPGLDQLRIMRSMRQRVGHDAIEHSRNRTFHYPAPSSRYAIDDELRAVLKAMEEEEANVVITGRGYVRLEFADRVALALAFGKHDPNRAREQAAEVMRGATAFVNVVTTMWASYKAARGLDDGLPPADNEDSERARE